VRRAPNENLLRAKMRARECAARTINMTLLLRFNIEHNAHDLRTTKHEGLYGRRCGRDACSVSYPLTVTRSPAVRFCASHRAHSNDDSEAHAVQSHRLGIFSKAERLTS